MTKLNRKQIVAKWETLNPRERDAWVADVVFGWTEINSDYGVYYKQIGVRSIPLTGYIAHYTTDISAAWAVVDKMREDYRFLVRSTEFKSDVIRVIFCTDDQCFSESAECKTTPEAIGLAAITAKITRSCEYGEASAI